MSGLREAAGAWFVVKIGGELAQDPQTLAAGVGRAVRAFLDAGIKVAVVHGAGPQATALSKRLGLVPNMVGGRRVTDAATLEAMKMALAGQVAVDLAAALRLANVPAICTSGVSAGLVDATKRPATVVSGGPPEPVDFGLVGDVSNVNVQVLEALAQAGLVPVLSSLCGSPDGTVYNVNADTVATRVAAALEAQRLFLVSGVPGVLADREDPGSRFPRLTPSLAHQKIAEGVIQGGMIPKVEESLEMLDRGIGAIHIVGVNPPEALLQDAAEPGSSGTVFVRDPA